MDASPNPEKCLTVTWSQDDAIAFECARECITHLMAIYSAMIHAEETQPEPDQLRLSGLIAEQAKLAEERRNLRATDRENVARIRKEYGALIRSLLANRANSAAQEGRDEL